MPLAIDLYCGLGGWTDGLLAEGWQVIGFDIERHQYGEHRYPAQLVLQDVLTLHGSQFRNADLIVASPPCQAYSYRAMPWRRAKALPPPDNTLFDTCFRIQREACAAAGRHIPLIVENVRGAQKWVGRSRWNYGSFHLWGDVPALMPISKAMKGVPHRTSGHWTNPKEHLVCDCGHREDDHGPLHDSPCGRCSCINPVYRKRTEIKNSGGSWFNIAHNTTSGVGRNPDGRKQLAPPSFKARQRPGMSENSGGNYWFQEGASRLGSQSSARKAASAMIAKIPLPLARYIGRVFKPQAEAA